MPSSARETKRDCEGLNASLCGINIVSHTVFPGTSEIDPSMCGNIHQLTGSAFDDWASTLNELNATNNNNEISL